MPTKRQYPKARRPSISEIYDTAQVSRSKLVARSIHDLRNVEEDVWYEEDALYKDHIVEILNKWQNLDDGIWAKIICLERNRRVAKAYARSQNININGSEVAFDGVTIGLAGFNNPFRDSFTEETLKEVKGGLSLYLDKDGNIWAEKRCRCRIFTLDCKKGLGKVCLDRKIFLNDGELTRKCKVFDMEEFRANLIKVMDDHYADIEQLKYQTVITLCFNYNGKSVLNSPCTLLIVNMIALDILRSRFPLATGPNNKQQLCGHLKSVVNKVWSSVRKIASRSSRAPLPSMSTIQSWKGNDKIGGLYLSLNQNYLPLPFKQNSSVNTLPDPFSARYTSLHSRSSTMDSRFLLRAEPDPDYDSNSSSMSIVKNSHDSLSDSNNGTDADWDDSPNCKKLGWSALGPLNSVFRKLPIDASVVIGDNNNEDIMMKAVPENDKKLNSECTSTPFSSAQSSPADPKDDHIYSTIDPKEYKSSLSSTISNNESSQEEKSLPDFQESLD